MKKYNIILGMLVGILCFWACSDDDETPGNPILKPSTQFSQAYFGDSLVFSANVSDEDVPLSTLKAQVFYGEDMVSETVIRTKTSADYSGKVYIPYYVNIPNATATLKLILQNIHFTITEEVYDLPLSRPDFPYLTLVTSDRTYRMERVGLYQYKATEDFPQKVKGYIKTPAMGTQGNEITFGWSGGAIKEGVTSTITFSNATAGNYTIQFNTLNYEAAPFIKLMFAGEEMTMIDDDNYKIEKELTKGLPIEISGIADIDEWWIDPDFFKKGDDGKLTFLPIGGKYRITANFTHRYFEVWGMKGDDLATLASDGTGGVWIKGWGAGKPTLGNQYGWEEKKSIYMAPISAKVYQLTLVAGDEHSDKTIRYDYFDLKFFHQNGWGGEFGGMNLTLEGTDLVIVQESGNVDLADGKQLVDGKTYIFTLDLSGGASAGKLTITEKE